MKRIMTEAEIQDLVKANLYHIVLNPVGKWFAGPNYAVCRKDAPIYEFDSKCGQFVMISGNLEETTNGQS